MTFRLTMCRKFRYGYIVNHHSSLTSTWNYANASIMPLVIRKYFYDAYNAPAINRKLQVTHDKYYTIIFYVSLFCKYYINLFIKRKKDYMWAYVYVYVSLYIYMLKNIKILIDIYFVWFASMCFHYFLL